MKKKRILIISLIAIPLLTVSIFFIYLSFTMIPAKTGHVISKVIAVRNGSVSLFLYKSQNGYIAFDAGQDPEKVVKELTKIGIDPEEIHSIFFTHSDSDHAGGHSAFPHATLYLPQLEEPMILGQDERKIFGFSFRGSNPFGERSYTLVKSGETLMIDGVQITPVSTPGHSPGSTSYFVGEALAFVGDMAIIDSSLSREDRLIPMPDFINNDDDLAAKTVKAFSDRQRYPNLQFIFTAHDGVLMLASD